MRKLTTAASAGVLGLMAWAPTAHAATLTPADFVLQDINAYRSTYGLAPLTMNTPLRQTAEAWDGYMIEVGNRFHNPFLGASLNVDVPGWRLGGENVGMGASVVDVEVAFANSPEHRANLLNPTYHQAGIAVIRSGNAVWIVEDFVS